jgi:hypothetical protein
MDEGTGELKTPGGGGDAIEGLRRLRRDAVLPSLKLPDSSEKSSAFDLT